MTSSPSSLRQRVRSGWPAASLLSRPAKLHPSSWDSSTGNRLPRVLAHITGHGTSVETKPIASMMMSTWAGPIRKDEGNHGGQKARSPPGSAQGSGALVLEEPPYSRWDTAPELLAPSGHSLGCRHGHCPRPFEPHPLESERDSSVKTCRKLFPITMGLSNERIPMMARSTGSTLRSNTLMQLSRASVCKHHHVTRGRTIHCGPSRT